MNLLGGDECKSAWPFWGEDVGSNDSWEEGKGDDDADFALSSGMRDGEGWIRGA